jgi:thiamine biosynthesis protein ThiS
MMESTATDTIAIVVNGEPREAPAGATIEDFLRAHDLDPDLVVVERNGAIVSRRDVATTALEPGDGLEIVHFVGGG